MRPLILLLMLLACATTPLRGAEPPGAFPGTVSDWRGQTRHDFLVDTLEVTVVSPATPRPERPWVWRGEFFGAFADADLALVKDGWHLVYVKVPNLFGAPAAMEQWDKVYASMVQTYKLHPRPGFIGLSRGGLYCANWAIRSPERTLAVYLDNAVCDFKSWPGGRPMKLGTGEGSAAEWQNVLKAYRFKSNEEAIAFKGNPIDQLEPLARHKIPVLLVYGDADTVVPASENSDVVFDRLTRLGGQVERIVKPGQNHHPHGLTDVGPVVRFFNEAMKRNGG